MKKAIAIGIGCGVFAAVVCNLVLSYVHYKDVYQEDVDEEDWY